MKTFVRSVHPSQSMEEGQGSKTYNMGKLSNCDGFVEPSGL